MFREDFPFIIKLLDYVRFFVSSVTDWGQVSFQFMFPLPASFFSEPSSDDGSSAGSAVTHLLLHLVL